MRRFDYRLEKLLEVKAYAEKTRSLELAEVTGRWIKTSDSIESLKRMKKEVLSLRFKGEKYSINVDSLSFAENQISAIKVKIKNLENELEKITVEQNKMREIYVSALKEKKTIEKLKEKKQVLHMKNEKSRENRVLEDIVMTSYTIKGREVK